MDDKKNIILYVCYKIIYNMFYRKIICSMFFDHTKHTVYYVYKTIWEIAELCVF